MKAGKSTVIYAIGRAIVRGLELAPRQGALHKGVSMAEKSQDGGKIRERLNC